MQTHEETGGQKEGGLESCLAFWIFTGAIIASAHESLRGAGYLLIGGGILSLVAPFAVDSIFKTYRSIRRRQDNYNQ